MKPEPQDRPKPNLKAEGGWERSFRFSVFSVQPGSKERTRHFTLSALRFRWRSFKFVSFKHPDFLHPSYLSFPLSGLISPSGDPATRLSLRSSLFGRGGDLSSALPTVSVDRRGDLSPAWRPPVHSARFRFPSSSFILHPSSFSHPRFKRQVW